MSTFAACGTMQPAPGCDWYLADDVDDFLARAGDFLRSRSGLRITQLTWAERVRKREVESFGIEAPVFGLLERAGEACVTFCRLPPPASRLVLWAPARSHPSRTPPWSPRVFPPSPRPSSAPTSRRGAPAARAAAWADPSGQDPPPPDGVSAARGAARWRTRLPRWRHDHRHALAVLGASPAAGPEVLRLPVWNALAERADTLRRPAPTARDSLMKSVPRSACPEDRTATHAAIFAEGLT